MKAPLADYLRDMGRYPLLSPDEEREAAVAAKAGDQEARDRLITGNLRLVISIAKRYAHLGRPLADLIQEGNVGLITAAEKFDPSMNTRFSTYATYWIKNAIRRSLDLFPTVRIPVYLSQLIAQFRKSGM